jgi:hypothetical protein
MIYFVPANLNLVAVLEKNPPKFTHHIDNFVYLVGQITWMAARYRNLVDEEGYMPLHAPVLKHRIHNYVNHMRYLVENKVLERSKSYIPGERSYGYRFTKEYVTSPVVPVTITKYTLVKNIRSKNNWERNMEAKFSHLAKWLDEGLCLDFDAAMNRLEWLRMEDFCAGKFGAQLSYNASYANLMQLKEQEYYFNVDYTAGRVHSNLTSLRGTLRKYLTYNGRQLASVDVVASQPFLIANVLLSPWYYEKWEGERLSYQLTWGCIKKEIDIAEVQKHIKNLGPDAELFKQDVKGDFYTAFMQRVKQSGEETELTRDDMKKAVFLAMYSDNKFIHQEQAYLKRVFKSIYPSVYAVLSAYKIRKVRALPVLIQHIESLLVPTGVAKGLSKREKNMPLFTIHDSIVLPADEIELCKQAFAETYTSLVGATPNLKAELWVPEPGYERAPEFRFEEVTNPLLSDDSNPLTLSPSSSLLLSSSEGQFTGLTTVNDI